jgi:putative transposase
VDADAPIPEVTRTFGISEATYHVWRKRQGQMAAEIRRMRQLEEENRKLKQLVADLTLDKVILQELLAKRPEGHLQARAGAGRYGPISNRRAASVWALLIF